MDEKSVRLVAAIRRFTADRRDASGNLVPNGAAEEAIDRLVSLVETMTPEVAGAFADLTGALVGDTVELREAAEAFFGGDFLSDQKEDEHG